MRVMFLLALLAILGSTKRAHIESVPLIKHVSNHKKVTVLTIPSKDMKLLGVFVRDVMKAQIAMENTADLFSKQGNKALTQLVHLVMKVCHKEIRDHIKQGQNMWKGSPPPLLNSLQRMFEDYQKEYAAGQLEHPQLKTVRSLQFLEVMIYCQKELLLSLLCLIQSFFELFNRGVIAELLRLFGQVASSFRSQLTNLKMLNARDACSKSKLVETELAQAHSQAMGKLKDVETLLGMRLNCINFFSMREAQDFESDSQDVNRLLAQGTEESIDNLLKSQYQSYLAGVLHLTQVGRAIRNSWGLGSMHQDHKKVPSFTNQSQRMEHLLRNAIKKVNHLQDRNPRFNSHLHKLEKALSLLTETQDIVKKLVLVDKDFVSKAQSYQVSDKLLTQLEAVVSFIENQQQSITLLGQCSGSGLTADKIQQIFSGVTQFSKQLGSKWDEYSSLKSHYEQDTYRDMARNVGLFQGILSSLSGKCRDVQGRMLPTKSQLSHLKAGIKSSG